MFTRNLYLVDYKEKDRFQHQLLECLRWDNYTDDDVVSSLHDVIGKENRLDAVIEFRTDMLLDDFAIIYEDVAELVKQNIETRLLYFNQDTIENVRKGYESCF